MTSRKDADTALLFAIWNGNREYAIRLLNEFGADPNISDFKGRTGEFSTEFCRFSD
jgi:ankyrin repeat protein